MYFDTVGIQQLWVLAIYLISGADCFCFVLEFFGCCFAVENKKVIPAVHNISIIKECYVVLVHNLSVSGLSIDSVCKGLGKRRDIIKQQYFNIRECRRVREQWGGGSLWMSLRTRGLSGDLITYSRNGSRYLYFGLHTDSCHIVTVL